MTRKEFFTKLTEVKNKFVWDTKTFDKHIRGKLKHINQNTPDCTFCPIEAVAYCNLKKKSDYRAYDIFYSVSLLELKSSFADNVIHAADNNGARQTRKQLKETLGV